MRGQRGVASLEAVFLLPILVLLATLLLQVGAVVWTVNAADTAARHAARARSLGHDASSAADAALPNAMDADDVDLLADSGVRLTVRVPRVSLLPTIHVTREAHLP